jgi:ATPase subunit of ABC transporter with duplicated ATPase domains
MGKKHINRSGTWNTPSEGQIGYLDQHYDTLDPKFSPWESIVKEAPQWSREQCREHLNNFLFRKNEDINTKISSLSGGEKARLSLALIAATTPTLLIVDEVTNNLDLRTREHVIEILKAYPGALLAISHDEDFLEAICATSYNLGS